MMRFSTDFMPCDGLLSDTDIVHVLPLPSGVELFVIEEQNSLAILDTVCYLAPSVVPLNRASVRPALSAPCTDGQTSLGTTQSPRTMSLECAIR